MVTQTISALICLFIMDGMAEDTTSQIRGSWRYLNSTHLYTNKKTLCHSFTFDAPTLLNDLPDDVRSAPTLACFRKKLKSYLFDKAFPPWYLNFSASPWSLPGYVSEMMIIELDLVSCLRVCLGRD